ncbi:MAG: hypothetical protein HZA93_18595 [Verrucomicrobia bacterium]|nr:hypothetical protein [Verrucomicrobiota bacterium]
MSDPLIWSAPGPQAFVRRIAAEASSGNSVIVSTAGATPSDLAERVEAALMNSRHAQWPNAEAEPATALRACHSGQPHETDLLKYLMCACEWGATFYLVRSSEEATTKRWLDFLVALEPGLRRQDAATRPVFVLFALSENKPSQMVQTVALKAMAWADALNEVDFLAMAWPLASQKQDRHALLRRLRAHTLARVALWDGALMLKLALQADHVLLAPQALLSRHAAELGWTTATLESLLLGSTAEIEGMVVPHSALLVLRGQNEQLRGRLWQAQAAVLLSWLEEQRLELIERAKGFLGGVHRLDEFEIGEIENALRQLHIRPTGLVERAYRLRNARNTIAHLGLIEFGELRALLEWLARH